jgi:hypothetical protein
MNLQHSLFFDMTARYFFFKFRNIMSKGSTPSDDLGTEPLCTYGPFSRAALKIDFEFRPMLNEAGVAENVVK